MVGLQSSQGSAATCVAGAVITDGKVLLVRRTPTRSYYPNVWDLFGGHVETGETFEEALCREAQEELGISLSEYQFLGTVHDAVEPVKIHVFAISAWMGEPTNEAPGEHSDLGWFTVAELPESPGLDNYRSLVVSALSRAERTKRGER